MSRVLAVGLTLIFCGAAAAQEKTAESKILNQWVGTWKTEFVNRVAEWNPKEVKATGAITCKWILGGKFVEEAGFSTSPGVEHRLLWWYDSNRKAYRQAFFSSEGTTLETSGTWNEKTSTMTWQSDAGPGMTAISTHRFLDADTYEWTYIIRDAGGKTHLDMKGKHTRTK